MKRDELIENVFLTTEATQRAWKSLFHTIIREEDISPTQVYALFMLKNHQPINGKDFALQMQLTPGAVTQLIDSLGKYVERTNDDKDRRVTYLTLSKNGDRLLSRIRQKRKIFFKQIMEAFSDEELQILQIQQKKVLNQIEELDKN